MTDEIEILITHGQVATEIRDGTPSNKTPCIGSTTPVLNWQGTREKVHGAWKQLDQNMDEANSAREFARLT